MSNENNGHGARQDRMRRIVLTLDVDTQHIQIDAAECAMDEALGILERARLEVDARFRFQRGRELLIEQARQDQLSGIARDVLSGKVKM